MTGHARIERQVAALHAAIAGLIRDGDLRPIDRALENLERWRVRFGGDLPRAYQEWQAILEARDIPCVLATLLGDDDDSIRRRSSSPFTGILDPHQRLAIMRNAA